MSHVRVARAAAVARLRRRFVEVLATPDVGRRVILRAVDRVLDEYLRVSGGCPCCRSTAEP